MKDVHDKPKSIPHVTSLLNVHIYFEILKIETNIKLQINHCLIIHIVLQEINNIIVEA